MQIERFLRRACLSVHHHENYYYRFRCGCDAHRVQRICRGQSMLRQRRLEQGFNVMRQFGNA